MGYRMDFTANPRHAFCTTSSLQVEQTSFSSYLFSHDVWAYECLHTAQFKWNISLLYFCFFSNTFSCRTITVNKHIFANLRTIIPTSNSEESLAPPHPAGVMKIPVYRAPNYCVLHIYCKRLECLFLYPVCGISKQPLYTHFVVEVVKSCV